MNPERKRAVDFLRAKGMFYGDIDLDGEYDRFTSEMERGLQGTGDDAGSLEMSPTYIDADREIPHDEPVIAVDAGGTNFRVARVRFDGEATPAIDRYTKHPMPGLDRELKKEEFFRTIVEYLGPVLDTSAKMGICFSYPTEMYPNGDGKLIHFTKEIKAGEVEGEFIGEGVRAALREAGHAADRSLVLLNDTVATLLAGKAAPTAVPYDSYVGFILGTGTNCCYIESNVRIRKLKDADPGRSMIINIESGGYDKLPRGDIDRAFDATLNTPGQFAFEKMVSGAYFGPLALKVFKAAAGEGLLSRRVRDQILRQNALSTKVLNDFFTNPLRSGLLTGLDGDTCQEDVALLHHLVDCLTERAARLSAVVLSSAVLESGKGESPCAPVCITADGSVFHGLRSLKHRVYHYLREYLGNVRGRYVDFVTVDSAPLIGAAIAGLTNATS
jgi:hexokinase